eukprot:550352_1
MTHRMGNSESQLGSRQSSSSLCGTNKTTTKIDVPHDHPNDHEYEKVSYKSPSIDKNTQLEYTSVGPLESISFNKMQSVSYSTNTCSTSASTYLWSTSSSSTYVPPPTMSKILYYMDTNKLATLVKYIMEHEPYFNKYKHESVNTYNAFISYKIRGKMIVKYNNVEFCNRLPWIRKNITSLIYDRLRCLGDEDIEVYLSKICKPNDTKLSKINIELPDYLQQIDITTNRSDIFQLKLCNSYEFQIFVYILCKSNQYNEIEIKMLLNALIELDMCGAEFIELKRNEFYHKFRPYKIKAGITSKLYKSLLANSYNIYEYINNNNISIIINKTNNINTIKTTNINVTNMKNREIKNDDKKYSTD